LTVAGIVVAVPDSRRTPPVPLVRVVERVRAGLQTLTRKLVPGNIALLDIANGSWTTQALYVAAKLGIADELAGGPLSAAEVASRVGADPDSVYRLMRALAGKGVFEQRRGDAFALTSMGDAMRADTPGNIRALILLVGDPSHWEHWGNLLHSVKTGETAPKKLRGTNFFEYLDTNPELAVVFNDAMTSMSAMAIDPVLAAYDFTRFGRIVDVGGGHGSLLAAVLRRRQRRAVRSAVGGRGGTAGARCCRGRRSLHRDGRLVHGIGSRGRRRLPAQDDHPRLGRGDRAAHPAQRPRGDGTTGEAPVAGNGSARA
jgi:hypothetical protein